MTDELDRPEPTADPNVPLPDVVTVTTAFASRLPTQRVLDQLQRIEDVPFGTLLQNQGSRVTAFRKLVQMFPGRDATSLWMHAYDVEVEVELPDPKEMNSSTPSPPFAGIGESVPR
jgi:hypothetical protein